MWCGVQSSGIRVQGSVCRGQGLGGFHLHPAPELGSNFVFTPEASRARRLPHATRIRDKERPLPPAGAGGGHAP